MIQLDQKDLKLCINSKGRIVCDQEAFKPLFEASQYFVALFGGHKTVLQGIGNHSGFIGNIFNQFFHQSVIKTDAFAKLNKVITNILTISGIKTRGKVLVAFFNCQQR